MIANYTHVAGIPCTKRFCNAVTGVKIWRHTIASTRLARCNDKCIRSFAIEISASPSIIGTIPKHGRAIQVGQFAELHRSFSQEDVHAFGKVIGDMNPVHFPPTQDTSEIINKDPIGVSQEAPIVHGMLLSSLFSAIFGTLIPGAIYRSQSLKFNNSVSVGETIIGRVIVRNLKEVRRNNSGVLCMCDTVVAKSVKGASIPDGGSIDDDNEVIAISGEAQVWLPGATIGR
jgi:acyl dehydratase